MSRSIDTYKTRAGSSALHGHKFERDVLCLLYIRCLNMCKMNKLNSFKIANNMDHVGVFDDIVCRIEYKENGSFKSKIIFMQTKHSENPEKHPFSHELLIPTKKKSIRKQPPILKYIESFLQIRQIVSGNEQRRKFSGEEKSEVANQEISERLRNVFHCKIEDSQFVYYTNATEGEMKYFQKFHDTDIVAKLFDTNSMDQVYKLNLDIIAMSNLFPKIYDNLKQSEIDSVNQFLDQFYVYINQKSHHNLEEIIKNEIKIYLPDLKDDTDVIYSMLYEEMNHIFCATYGTFLTEQVDLPFVIRSFITIQSQTKSEIEKYNIWHDVFCDELVETLYNDIKNCKFICIPYRKLEKYKILVKCVQLTAKIRYRDTSISFLYIDKNSHNALREIRNLYNYKKYSKVLLCIDNIAVDEFNSICSVVIDTHELIMIISEKKSANEPSLWKQLSPSGRDKIMNYNIIFQGVHSTLRNILGDIDLHGIFTNADYRKVLESFICRVLNNEIISIGSKLLFEEEIYIERKYKKCNCYTLEALNEKEDMFIIYPKCNISNSISSSGNSNVLIFDNKEEATHNFHSRMEAKKNTHLCFVDSYLMLISSNGTLEKILKYKSDKVVNEEEFLQHILNNKYTVLCDNVGKGKSIALKQLTSSIKHKHSDCWIEYIQLILHDEKFKNVESNLTPVDTVIHLLNLNDIEKMIFQCKCKNDGKIALFFDGFDEMSQSSRKNFNVLLKTLSETKIQTILVATRPNVEKELEGNLLSFRFNIIGFSFEDMQIYLLKYWSQNIDKTCTEKLQKTVQHMVEQAKNLKDILRDIVAVPLQTKMFAASYNKKIGDILSSEAGSSLTVLQNLNLYSLYNNFINMHIDRCAQEKFNINNSNSSNYELMKNLLFKKESGIWEYFACQEMFPSMKLCNVEPLDIEDLVKQRIGILVDTKPIQFVHRSFAEFLAAKHVSKLLYESQNTELIRFFYQKIGIDEIFFTFRKFMNACYENERQWETAEIDRNLFHSSFAFDIDDTVLTAAIKEGNEYIFKVILQHHSKNENTFTRILNIKNNNEASLLHLSAIHCEQVFDDILNSRYFQRANDCDESGQTALHVACDFGRENAVKSFMNKFKNESLSAIIDQTDKKMNTPLTLAARKGHTNIVKILHHHGASIRSKDGRTQTVLMHAAEGGFIETVKYLIEQFEIESMSAIFDQTDDSMMTPLMLAAREGHTKLVKILHHHGASIHSKDILARTALMYAARCGHIETVKFLVEQDAEVNGTDENGLTTLMWACIYREKYKDGVDCIRYLVEQAGADVNIRDQGGKTAVMYLIMRHDNIKILKCLIQHGTDIKVVDSDGRNPAMYAAEYKQIETMKYLFKFGACDVNQVDKKEESCITLCAIPRSQWKHFVETTEKGNLIYVKILDIIKYLIQQGAMINHQNHSGNTLLHLVLLKVPVDKEAVNFIKLIEHLVELGADIYLNNKNGVTPAMVAEKHKIPQVRSYFQTLINTEVSSSEL